MPSRGAQGHLPLHAVQHGHDRRAHHHRVRQVQRIGIHIRQILNQPDHVIAQIAEQARRDRRHALGHRVDPAFRDQGPKAVQRRAGIILEVLREPRLPVDPRPTVAAFPDQVGLHADDRIAAAQLSARDRFQHEALRCGLGQLQHQADRGVQVRGQPDGHQLVATCGPFGLELRKFRRQLHHWTWALMALIADWFNSTADWRCA